MIHIILIVSRDKHCDVWLSRWSTATVHVPSQELKRCTRRNSVSLLKRTENGVPPLTQEARTGNGVGSCRMFCSEKETKKGGAQATHLLKGMCFAKLTVIVRLWSNSLSQKTPSNYLSDWNSPASKLRIASHTAKLPVQASASFLFSPLLHVTAFTAIM